MGPYSCTLYFYHFIPGYETESCEFFMRNSLNFIVYAHGRLCCNWFRHRSTTISYPQCSLTFLRERYLHSCREQSFAIRAYAMSAVGIDVVSVHKLFVYRVVNTVSTDIVSSHTKYRRIAYGSQDSRMHCKVQMNEWPLILWRFNCILTKEWDETRPPHLCLKSNNEDFSVSF